MTDENMKTFRQDNFKEVVIPDDLQDLLKWTEVDRRIVDTMKAIVTQYAAQVDAAMLDECSKVAMKFGISVDEERLVQALTDAQKFYCEGYRAGEAAARAEILRCKNCTLWDREHIEMHPHSTEQPEQQAEFAECRKWSTWNTCFMTRSDDYCSQAKRRDGK